MTAQNALAFPGLLMRSLGPALLEWSERRRVPAVTGFLPTDIEGLAAWYDPSDLSTMWQSSKGDYPVAAAGDPVGLMLDKSQGLRRVDTPVEFVYGNDNDWTVDEEAGTYTRTDGSGFSELRLRVTAGKFYEVKLRVQNIVGDFRLIRRAETGGVNENIRFLTQSTTEEYITAMMEIFDNGSTPDIVLSGLDATYTISEISVKEVPGNHLTQPAAAACPTYQTDGTKHWLDFDGVDDFIDVDSRFGLIANPALTSVMGVQPTGYVDAIERLWYIGPFGGATAGTLSAALGSAGISWRHNDGYSIHGTLAEGTDAVLTHARAVGAVYDEELVYLDGEMMVKTESSGVAGVPFKTDESFRIGADGGGANTLAFRMYGFSFFDRQIGPLDHIRVVNHQRRKAGLDAVFTPADLRGLTAWYDPSDRTTLLSSVYGKTYAATAGDPVALVLDKSQGLQLGPELVTNGGFDNGLDGWTSSASSWVWDASGRAYLDGDDSPQALSQDGIMEVGKVYRLEFDVEISGGSFGPQTGTNGFQVVDQLSESGHYVYTILADTNRLSFKRHTGAIQVYVDNVSLREIKGNHLSQLTAAACPTYQTDGSVHWLEFDGVDDVLALPEPLPFSAQMSVGAAFEFPDGQAYSSSYPHVLSNRGTGGTAAARHPLLFASANAPDTVYVSWGTNGSPRVFPENMNAHGPAVIVSGVSPDARFYSTDAEDREDAVTGYDLEDGGTGEFQIGGPNKNPLYVFGATMFDRCLVARESLPLKQLLKQKAGI